MSKLSFEIRYFQFPSDAFRKEIQWEIELDHELEDYETWKNNARATVLRSCYICIGLCLDRCIGLATDKEFEQK